MKKENIIYIGIAVVVGLLVGYLIFGGNAEIATSDEHDHSTEIASGEMWTCSMHPQIMQPEPGSCPICGMDLIPADNGGEGLAVNQIKMTENAMVLAGVETVMVGSGVDGEDHIKISGKVAVNQESDAVQSAYFDGRIESLSINFEGEEVRKGQKLATIYAPALVSAQQELLTASKLKASQPQLYKAVRNKLKLWKLSEAQIDQIESSGQVLENFPVYANVSGVVSEIMVEEGDYIKTGSPLVKVTNLNSVWAIFDAYENQLSLFKEGQSLNVNTNSYPNETFTAKVSFVAPVLNKQTRTLEVRAELDNKKGMLKPGMFVQAEVEVASKQDGEVLTIPESAVLWTGKRSLVYVQPNPNSSTFEMREVELGNLMNGSYVVNSGLQSGEMIVAKGTFTVDAAAQLQGKKSMMNQEGETMQMGHEGHSEMGSAMKMEFSTEAEAKFGDLLKVYLDLKDALVASDQGQTQSLAKKGAGIAAEISGLQMDDMGKSHISQLAKQLTELATKKDLEGQREDFVLLSQNMIQIGQQMESLESKLYVQHCPMANNDKGADWLSLEEEIRNPYYGYAMLTCGSVVQTIN
ncbi:efflux RND transporter periplasmic adaptor subunit [Flagellimonas zhangzhouensis]|uniref:Membrane fusion protein, Cu(I)/Ag(I) efflux system n=1 Tax=Flagellimonas zhangzhouensis TaxID=1073328 RepID=A0A1H2VRQ8_9FLAO|nr:efflux RND transporter periplasmic adaptor subunit [Allomuricauda zhangzhouensis]SDQ06089.1 membrane fusion protein, Cu(I)/Ag(I) efflux system [Allomuricauda zhangzhouensis]SDW70966.1 membrane fusion protein, Cu(I)/Ag(I) efflux system [Allomuricauda zhangzhouensis]